MSKTHAQKIWSSILNHIQLNNLIASASFDNWFSGTEAIEMTQDQIFIYVPDEFSKDWLETKYTAIIENIYFELYGEKISFVFKTENTTQSPDTNKLASSINNSIKESDKYSNNINHSPLVEEYTFDNFIVGDGNRLAYNVALAAAEDDSSKYNPIFLYGNTGLGKTHLLHAIGHFIEDSRPDKKILYITCEDFVNDFIHFIRYKDEHSFKEKYRQLDVLMIDDIQFLAGKEKTQDEFFHTFNALHQLNKQIIISADVHPNQLTTLTDRLRSRFNWGIIIDILPPDIETRIAILQKKIKTNKMEEDISEDVIEYLASQFDSNVRELEGALRRLVAYATMFSRREITLELAMEALNGFTQKQTKTLTAQKIQKVICEYFKITVSDLKSKAKKQPLSQYRHIAIYLTKKHTSLSLHKIGKEYGNRDHSTILNSYNKIDKEIKSDINLRLVVDELEKKIT